MPFSIEASSGRAEELQDLVSYLEHQQPAATPSVASGQQRQAAAFIDDVTIATPAH